MKNGKVLASAGDESDEGDDGAARGAPARSQDDGQQAAVPPDDARATRGPDLIANILFTIVAVSLLVVLYRGAA